MGWHQFNPEWAEALVTDASIPRGAVVLDIGCRSGALILLLVLSVLPVHVLVVTLGCLWEWCAARGSRMAGGGLLVVGALEALTRPSR